MAFKQCFENIIKTSFEIIKWAGKAWPLLIFSSLFVSYLQFRCYFLLMGVPFDKIISGIAQVFGGIIILYTINSNIGLITTKSLFNHFWGYLNEFPLRKKGAIINLPASTFTLSTGHVDITATKNPISMDEKIAYLQEQINEIKENIKWQYEEINEKISHSSIEMNNKIDNKNSEVKRLESTLGEVTIGGVKMQIFGVLLIILGAFAAFLA